MNRRELTYIPAATALLRRRKPIAANDPPGRQSIANTHQHGVQGEQNRRPTRNNPMSQTCSDGRKDASQTSQNTKSP